MSLDDEITLELRYQFDETSGTTVPDSSGKDRHGTMGSLGNSGAVTTWFPNSGRVGGALKFDDYPTPTPVFDATWVNVPYEALNSIDDFTIAFWSNDPYDGTIFNQAVVLHGESSQNVVSIYIEDLQGLRHRFASLTSAIVQTPNSIEENGGIVDTNIPGWNHFAFTRSGGILKYYVNGWLRYQQSFSSQTITTQEDRLRIGYHLNGGPYTFAGYLDDFRIYSRALVATEIATLALLDLNNDPCLLAYYEMEDEPGLDVVDTSYFNNDGLILEDTPGTGPVYDVAAGRIDGALDFLQNAPFVDNYEVDVPDAVFQGLDDYTVAVWVKLPFGTNSTEVVFTCDRNQPPSVDLKQFEIRAWSAGVIIQTPSKQSGFTVPGDVTPWSDNDWHHICITRRLSDMDCYFDGVLAGSAMGVDPQSCNLITDSTRLGKTETQNYTGLIDDFRVYCRVLTPVEIRTLAMNYQIFLQTEILSESSVTPTLDVNTPEVQLATEIDSDSVAEVFARPIKFEPQIVNKSQLDCEIYIEPQGFLEMQITVVPSDLFRDLVEVEE